MKTLKIALILGLLVLPTLAWTATAETPLTRISAGLYATKSVPAPAGIIITGEVDFMGVTGPYRAVLSRDGRFVQELGGPLPQVYGFDGETAWDRDWNGSTRVLHLKERDENILESLLWSGAWSRGHDENGRLRLAPVTTGDDGMQRVDLDFGERGMKGQITIDPARQQVVGFAYGMGDNRRITTLSDFRDFAGLNWPATLEQTSADDAMVSLHVTDVAFVTDEAQLAELLQPRLATAENVRFDNTLPATLELKKAPTGHLLVHPLLDGQDIGWFIFDTGAGANVLDNEAAAELGYEGFGEIQAKGVGGKVDSRFFRGKTLQLGRLELADPAYIGLDLNFLTGVMGVKLSGIIGYGVLSRSIVEFDHEAPAISLLDPAAYELTGGQWSPIMLADRHPCVPGTFEGHEGVLRLDTGANGSVTFHRPTTERLDLLRNRRVKDTQLGGVGGFVKGKEGPMQWLELGNQRFENVTVSFAIEDGGVFGDAYVDGNVGNELMAPFLLVFDYQQSRMAFRKR